MRTTRLTSDHWITAGFDALHRGGPNTLAAEPLARQLGTTKGSFYWHFKNLPAYHAALITTWHDRTMAIMVTLLERDGSADQRLRDFGAQVLGDPVEPSMRIWAQTNANVAEMLRALDTERLTYLGALMRQLGLGNPDFARALLASLAGLPQISPDDRAIQQTTFDTLVDTVLALSQ
jgi:AcrR family transcriptional regulator